MHGRPQPEPYGGNRTGAWAEARRDRQLYENGGRRHQDHQRGGRPGAAIFGGDADFGADVSGASLRRLATGSGTAAYGTVVKRRVKRLAIHNLTRESATWNE